MLSERQKIILKTIIDEFTRTAEPVGSKTLMNLLAVQVSSATLRNEMAKLEEFGLLEKTHTSSGRIPSSKGYRYYVENLMEKQLDDEIQNTLTTIFHERHYSMEEIIKKSCDILSQMTNLTSVVLGPETKTQTLEHVQLFPINERSAVGVFITNHGHTENKTFHFDENVSLSDIQTCCNLLNDKLSGTPISDVIEKMEEIKPLLDSQIARHEVLFQAFVSAFVKFASDNVYTSGTSNMLYQPEFSDIKKLRELMKMLEDTSIWRQLGSSEGDVVVRIGESNEVIPIDNVSVVSSKFKINEEEEGQLMVVGPTRMPYNRVVALMEYMAKVIEEMYSENE
ncbi:MAG: heat-inducible transcription repressor HrcA [Erysipelotrichia bacterium]|nr:heat-inducible transcription repressor HrcA [Erysipelotrichia bacterium]